MDIYELRAQRLKEIIGENTIKEFADAFDLDASYLSQLLNGHRRMGEKAAATLERKIGLSSNTLSIPVLHITGGLHIYNLLRNKGLKPHTIQKFNNSDQINYTMRLLSDEEIAERDRLESLSVEQAAAEDENGGTQEVQGIYFKPEAVATGPALAVSAGSVPVVGKAMLGTDGYFEELDYPAGHGDGRLMVPSTDPNAYGLRVVGSSMMPRIKNGEFVLIEPNHTYMSGDEVLIRTVDGKSMIKEFIYFRDGLYRFDSVNPGTEPILLPAEQIEKIHYVAGILKSSRFSPDHD